MVCPLQGIPFFHAGDELLRSKSLDRDSYNSGDWFNRYGLNMKFFILTLCLIFLLYPRTGHLFRF